MSHHLDQRSAVWAPRPLNYRGLVIFLLHRSIRWVFVSIHRMDMFCRNYRGVVGPELGLFVSSFGDAVHSSSSLYASLCSFFSSLPLSFLLFFLCLKLWRFLLIYSFLSVVVLPVREEWSGFPYKH